MTKKGMDIVIIISVIILIILFILIIFTAILGKDIKPPNVDDLKVTRLELDDADNAFTYLQEIPTIRWYGSKYDKASACITNGENIVDILLPIITNSQDTLKLITRALECKHLQVPEIKSFDTLMPYIPQFRHHARLKAFEAHLLFAQNNEEQAFTSALNIVRFGEMIQNSGGVFITYLVGNAVEEIGLDVLEDILPRVTLSSSNLIHYANMISTGDYAKTGFINSMKAEYLFFCTAIEDIIDGNMQMSDFSGTKSIQDFLMYKKSFFFLPNLTKQYMVDDICFIIKSTKEPYNKVDQTYFDTILNERSISNMLLKKNYVGKDLREMISPAFEGSLKRIYRIMLHKESIRTLLALKAYQKDNDKLPDALHELVPHYINKVPVDPYDGKNLRYSQKNKIIYSVGKNFIDDSGSDIQADTYHKGRWTAEDIVFPIR